MPLTKIGWGRKEICEACENWVVRPGDKFPHCESGGNARVVIDYDLLNAEEPICPLNKLVDAVEIDVKEIAADGRDERIAAVKAAKLALLKPFCEEMDKTTYEAKILEAVTAGRLTEQEGIDLGDELSVGKAS